jgi:hypothetical protein
LEQFDHLLGLGSGFIDVDDSDRDGVGGFTTNLPFKKKDARGNVGGRDHGEYNADDRDAWWVKWITSSMQKVRQY